MIEDTPQRRPQPNLFILTLWQHEVQGDAAGNDAEPTLTGRVVHITSGRACTFDSPLALGTLLLDMLSTQRKEHAENRAETGEKDGPSDSYLQQGDP